MRTRWIVVAVAWIALFPAAGWAALCGSLSGTADVSEDFEFINTSPAGGESFDERENRG